MFFFPFGFTVLPYFVFFFPTPSLHFEVFGVRIVKIVLPLMVLVSFQLARIYWTPVDLSLSHLDLFFLGAPYFSLCWIPLDCEDYSWTALSYTFLFVGGLSPYPE